MSSLPQYMFGHLWGTWQFIVQRSHASNMIMMWSKMFSLTFVGVPIFPLRKKRLWTFWLTRWMEDPYPDILFFGWVGRKHDCVDVTEVSPLVGFRTECFTTGHAALKVVECKMTKHENICIENQHVYTFRIWYLWFSRIWGNRTFQQSPTSHA